VDGTTGHPPLEIVIFDAPVTCADWPGGVVWHRPPPAGVHFALALELDSAKRGEARASFYPSYADDERWLDRSYSMWWWGSRNGTAETPKFELLGAPTIPGTRVRFHVHARIESYDVDRSYGAPDGAVDTTPKVPLSVETLEGDYDALLCE
jgi:hypothetical protein